MLSNFRAFFSILRNMYGAPSRGRCPSSFCAAGRIADGMRTILGSLPLLFILLSFFIPASNLPAQDWVHTGTNLGNSAIRIAAADFKPASADPQTPPLKAVFDATLYNDLNNAGIFDLVSKSLAPQATPGSPQEMVLKQWSAAPANAAMVAFGALGVNNGRLMVSGWLFDTRNTASPQVLGQQYNEVASEDMARTIAHRFADAIIYRLGGGINGICRNQNLFYQLAHRLKRDLGDGLRRRKPAPDHAPGHHFHVTAHLP